MDSMGKLGIERLSVGLYCDMSLCYAHFALSMVWTWEFLFPLMRKHCQSRTMGCRTELLHPASPVVLIPVHSIYGTVECYPAQSPLLSCTLPTTKASNGPVYFTETWPRPNSYNCSRCPEISATLRTLKGKKYS